MNNFNVYLVYTKESQHSQREITGYYEPRYHAEYVVAKSRGQARYIFTKHFGLDFTEPLVIENQRWESDAFVQAGIVDPAVIASVVMLEPEGEADGNAYP